MNKIAATLIVTFLALPYAHAVLFPLVELTPENLEEHGFSIRVMPTTEGDTIRFLIGFERVPSFLEERCETILRIREGNNISLEATLKPMDGLKNSKVGFSIRVPKSLLAHSELYITEGTRSSFDHKFLLPLSKFIKVEQTGPGNPRPFGTSGTDPENSLHFDSITDAVQYVQNESNILSYKGPVFGSERYVIVLPSGNEVTNWLVNCAFSDVFRDFGKEAIPSLIELSGSDVEYLRVGAYNVLQTRAGRFDPRSHSQTLEIRRTALAEWKAWWERNKNNPRLDLPVTRVYPAEDWETQRVRY